MSFAKVVNTRCRFGSAFAWVITSLAEASSGPTRLTTCPEGMLGEMWSANAASGRAMSSSPSSIMKRAP